jgi:mannose-6-phosphate isomerase-like protein (cupin superfamily)
MRIILSLAAFLFASSPAVLDVPAVPEGAPNQATYVSLADVQATTSRTPQAGVNPQPNIRVVDAGGYNVAVGAIHRPETPPGVAAVHFKVSEIYHVIDGGGTLVTGGTMVNSKTRPPDSESVRLEDGPGASGTSIDGGMTRQIRAGDVVVIPAGVPHWFSKIEGSITYLVVRVDPTRVLNVK